MEVSVFVAGVLAIFIAGVAVGAVFHAVLTSGYTKAIAEIETLKADVVALKSNTVAKIEAVKKAL